MLFFISGIILLSFWQLAAYVIIFFIIRETIFAILFKLIMKRLKEKNLLLISLLYDIIWPVLASLMVILNKFATKTPKWK